MFNKLSIICIIFIILRIFGRDLNSPPLLPIINVAEMFKHVIHVHLHGLTVEAPVHEAFVPELKDVLTPDL
jgi:hypothetical protein